MGNTFKLREHPETYKVTETFEIFVNVSKVPVRSILLLIFGNIYEELG